jgi:hypothetical protein
VAEPFESLRGDPEPLLPGPAAEPGKLRIRMHRGSLEESMATAQAVPASEAGVRAYLKAESDLASWVSSLRFDIEVTCYGGVDPRTGWSTYLVLVDGFPIAWTDGLWPGARRRHSGR